MPEGRRSAVGCTITTRGGMPAARVLARTYSAHHPDHDFLVVVLDAAGDSVEHGYRVVGPGWLDLGRAEFLRMATCYDAGELAAAVRPRLLRHLLAEYDVAVFIQPESKVFAPLPEVVVAARAHDVVLTPRLREPLPADGRQPDDAALPGTYDVGFLAVGQGAKSFLDFVAEHERLPADAKQTGSAEQRVLDRAAALFGHAELREPGFAAAYWNAHELAEGTPVPLFQFVGHDPGTPWLLSTHCVDDARVLLSADSALRELCADYRTDLQAADSEPYRFAALPDGTELTPVMRELFREADDAPPHPFGDDLGAGFRDWLSSAETPLAAAAGLNRLVTGLWRSRVDLQVAFPQPHGATFREWCRTHGVAEGEVPSWAAPREPARPARPVAEFGVNLAGYLTADLGLGEMGRVVHDVLRHAAVPIAAVVEEQALTCGLSLAAPSTTGRPKYPVSVLAVNSDYTKLLLDSYPEVGHGRYRIGLWAWELEEFPDWLHSGFDLVDEVWTVSEFCRRSIAAHSPVPVKVIPVPVPDPGEVVRPERRPGDPIRFLFAFDFNSTAARKNPDGLVSAFQRAFPGRADVRLTIKATNSGPHAAAAERLRTAIADDSRIELIDRYLSTADFTALYATSDAYVSLHRSEGFGLTVAEAMIRGLPVIATAYAGTAEFFGEGLGWPVPYRMAPVGPGSPPYQATALWADPDLDAAAAAMRAVADDPAEAARRGSAARAHLLRTRTVEAAAEWMRRELDAAYRAWRERPADRNADPRHRAADPVVRAREALHWRADTSTPSRVPFAGGLRKAVLRAIDHYDVHQREVLGVVVDGMAEALDAAGTRTDSLEADTDRRMVAMAAQLDRIERLVRSLGADEGASGP
ncbi:glycosyltransferase [Actinokineospora sp.]|uniref:glycosyltransferase n=1 Tax=Actinokineospora sp. TaxID=1872133 RepID=UPI00403772F3